MNVYNIVTVHAVIVRGMAWKNVSERTVFLRRGKYNVGGFIYSLIELEHGILRAQSSSPVIFGPFSATMSFSG